MVAPSLPLLQEEQVASPGLAPVKLLDLLTNRYHVGVVRARQEHAMALELPLSARLRPGQRVRFIVAVDRVLVTREQMRSGLVTLVQTDLVRNCQRVELAVFAEAAAA